MKNSYSVFACAALFVFSSCLNPQQTASKKQAGGEGAEEDVARRMQWDLERLADPATGKIPFGIRDRELAYAATLPNDAEFAMQRGAGTWDFRGPWNVGGRTRALAIDVANENNILAGGVSGGMWRSNDGGASWTRTTPLPGYPGVNAIAQDRRPGHQNVWYYLSGEAYGTSASGGSSFYLGNGMYKSLDSGMTWTSVASTVSGTPQLFDNVWDVTWNVVTDPGNVSSEVLYAAVYDAIYRSTNGGSTWARVKGWAGTQATSSYFADVAVTTTSVVYATLSSDGLQKGIWRSPNGTTFTSILPTGFPPVYDRLAIGIDPNNENIIYFFGPTPGYGRRSTDFLGDTLWNSLWKYEYLSGTGAGAGGTWTDLSANLPGNIGVFNGMNTQGGYDVVVKVKPGNSNIVFLGGTNIFRSTSAFSDSLNTEVMGGYAIGAALPFVDEYPGHHPDQHAFAFLPSNPDIMYSGCDGGVSKTIDNTATPVVWNEKNDGYITSQFYTIAVDHGLPSNVIIGGLQDNGTYYTRSLNSTSPWVHSIDGDGSYCQISDSGTYYYFSKQQGKMVKATVDTVGNMTAYRRIDPIGATGYRFINPFILDPNNNNLMYMAGGKFIWRNDDLSAIALTNQYDSISTNWTQFPDSVPGASEAITALAVSATPANRLLYGTNQGHVYKIDNANSGAPSPVNITDVSQFPSTAYVSCIAVNPMDADKILLVFSNYSVYSLFYSTDGGTTWSRVAGNLEQLTSGAGNGPSCRWASILPVSNGTVFLVGTSTGLYATDSLIPNGTVWVQQGANTIGSVVVDMMDVRMSDGLVAVATHGNGVFSANITSTNMVTGIRPVASLAGESSLSLYPNPVSSSFTFMLKKGNTTGKIRTELLNEMGQRIKVLNAVPDAGGRYEVDAADLLTGIYYLRVTSGKTVLTKGFVKQ